MTSKEIQIRFADNLLKAMEYVEKHVNITAKSLANALNITISESETILRHISI